MQHMLAMSLHRLIYQSAVYKLLKTQLNKCHVLYDILCSWLLEADPEGKHLKCKH